MSGDCRTVLPTNIDERLNALDLLGCERLEPLDDAAKELPELRDPMSVDPRYLPIIADDIDSIRRSDDMTDEEWRRAIAVSMRLHRAAGTVWALERAYRAYHIRARVEEWWEYDGEPYHFRLDLSAVDREITPRLVRRTERIAERYKNVRSILDDIRLGYLTELSVAVSAGGVGEVSCIAEMIDGYECDTDTVAYIYAGAVGEVSATAVNTA